MQDIGKIPWKRKWHRTPAFLLEKSHGQRSLVGYSPWGHKQSDMAEHTLQGSFTSKHTLTILINYYFFIFVFTFYLPFLMSLIYLLIRITILGHFFSFIFNLKIVALKYCVFCHITMWISITKYIYTHTHTYIYPLPLNPPFHSLLQVITECQAWLPVLYSIFPLAIYLRKWR